MTKLPPWIVRVGLFLVRGVLKVKAVGRWFLGAVGSAGGPTGRFFLFRIVLPLYHLGYVVRRRLGHWYSPAKNRIMFLLTNRSVVQLTVVAIVVVAGVVNVNMNSVRAETFGEKSLLYSLVTKDETSVIEEYAYERGQGAQYLTDSLAASSGSTTEEVAAVMDASLAGGGSLVALPISSSAASVAPRDTVVTYTVASGDTLSTIAEQFGISMSTISWANNLSSRSILRPGQQLTILPVSGVQHTVKSGETLSKIAQKYDVDQEEILAFNKLGSANDLTIGQALIVPGGEIAAPVPTRTSTATAVRTIFSSPTGTQTTSIAPGARMAWPAVGHYIVRGLSWYHSGVDIDCDGHRDGTSTQDIFAAADGVIQRAGWYGGYGLSVDISHGNGLVTRYGHFHSLYVQAGATVATGQALGRCGSTGNSSGTHLHFEVRAGGALKNPLEYIR